MIIENLISNELFILGDRGYNATYEALGGDHSPAADETRTTYDDGLVGSFLQRTVVCLLQLKDGRAVAGAYSAPAGDEFNFRVARAAARNDAMRQLAALTANGDNR